MYVSIYPILLLNTPNSQTSESLYFVSIYPILLLNGGNGIHPMRSMTVSIYPILLLNQRISYIPFFYYTQKSLKNQVFPQIFPGVLFSFKKNDKALLFSLILQAFHFSPCFSAWENLIVMKVIYCSMRYSQFSNNQTFSIYNILFS